MSLEQILKEIRDMSGKVTTLSEDVERLKEKDKVREEEGRLEGPRSRSRSPISEQIKEPSSSQVRASEKGLA